MSSASVSGPANSCRSSTQATSSATRPASPSFLNSNSPFHRGSGTARTFADSPLPIPVHRPVAHSTEGERSSLVMSVGGADSRARTLSGSSGRVRASVLSKTAVTLSGVNSPVRSLRLSVIQCSTTPDGRNRNARRSSRRSAFPLCRVHGRIRSQWNHPP